MFQRLTTIEIYWVDATGEIDKHRVWNEDVVAGKMRKN